MIFENNQNPFILYSPSEKLLPRSFLKLFLRYDTPFLIMIGTFLNLVLVLKLGNGEKSQWVQFICITRHTCQETRNTLKPNNRSHNMKICIGKKNNVTIKFPIHCTGFGYGVQCTGHLFLGKCANSGAAWQPSCQKISEFAEMID